MTWNWSETTPHAIHMANPCTERAGSEQLKFELCPNINSNSWDLHGFTKKNFFITEEKNTMWLEVPGFMIHRSWICKSVRPQNILGRNGTMPQKNKYTYRWVWFIGHGFARQFAHKTWEETEQWPKKINIHIDGFTHFFYHKRKKQHVDWSSWVYDSSVMELHVSSPTKHFGKKRNNAPQKKYTYRYIHMYIYYIKVNM